MARSAVSMAMLGVSVRAAAYSARRAGFSPIGFDRFGDIDLRAVAQFVPWPSEPSDVALAEKLVQSGADGWLYMGGWENHPDRVDHLAQVCTLWGNPGRVLRRVRDPVVLADALRASGHPSPAVRRGPEGIPRDGSWLLKPLASTGGRGVVAWDEYASPPQEAAGESFYYQERIEGQPLASIHLATDVGCELIGVTRQLLGRPGAPFGYTGSLGPWPIEAPSRAEIQSIGERIATWAGLRGIFGIDLMLDASGRSWAVEVNPRYTASVEVLELALRRAILADHVCAFGGGATKSEWEPLPAADLPPSGPRIVGKAIVWATRPGRVEGHWTGPPQVYDVPQVADWPGTGAHFQAGQPVLTVLAEAPNLAECRRRLTGSLHEWQSRLIPSVD